MSYNSSCGYGTCQTGYGRSAYTNPMQEYAGHASQLEQIAQYTKTNASIAEAFPQYLQLHEAYELQREMPEEIFLNPARHLTKTIQKEDEIMPYVKEAFEKTTGKEFPSDAIKIAVLSEEAFKEVHEAHNGAWSEGVQGFAINRNGKGINEIFAKRNHLDSLMLTIGHEIGHVMSFTLQDERDEEAKAFAFSMAWMKAIKENNIAGIADSINPKPAVNGVHDKAFEFVLGIAEEGSTAMEIFERLTRGELSVANRLEVVHLR